MYVKTSLASPGSIVVVPRRSRLPLVDLLISRWRLWPQFRLILPVAVRPKRFFAPLFVFSLGISTSRLRPAAPRHLARRPFERRYIAMPRDERKRGTSPLFSSGAERINNASPRKAEETCNAPRKTVDPRRAVDDRSGLGPSGFNGRRSSCLAFPFPRPRLFDARIARLP